MPASRREVLAGGVAVSALSGLAAAAAPEWEAVVAASDWRGVPAAPRFATLAAALAAAPRAGDRPFRIWIARGSWTGQTVVDAPNVRLSGEDRHATRITFTAASGQIAPDGKPYGTYRTATMKVAAPGFHATNLTIENGFDDAAEMRKPRPHLMSDDRNGPQAVALMLAAGSDDVVLDRVDIISDQDTFFPDAGRTLVRDSLIAGSYDFIFGAGEARLDRCEIRSRLRPDPAQVTGYIAAPSTLRDHARGLIFDRCRLTREAGVADGSVYLGRPWRPSKRFDDGTYGNPDAAGMAAYLRCWMDAHIAPVGWTEMWYTDRAGNPLHMLQPEEARFAEYASRGPGARGRRRGAMLTAAEAAGLRAGV